MAISHYDHVRELTSGRVEAEGIDLTVLEFGVEEIFFRFAKYQEWDIGEMSMGKYISLVSRGDTSLTAIPVFPSRMFRHSSIYVRRDGRVKTPQDLKGSTIGVPEWSQSASVYSRGMLVHDHGLNLVDITWVQAGVNEPGRVDTSSVRLPEGVELTSRSDSTLNALLLSGKIDAVLSAHAPEAFDEGNPEIVRLFPDYEEVERDYYARTGVFPIMHTIVIKRSVAERYPWVPMNLYMAFNRAKDIAVARLLEVTASRIALPWAVSYAEKAVEMFGRDGLWPYGVEANRVTLESFAQWAFEHGVAHRLVGLDEMFAPQTQEIFKI